jgi:hypothetical protein
VQKLDLSDPRDKAAEDAELAEKLEELRVEVHKRDIQRKFEAINS